GDGVEIAPGAIESIALQGTKIISGDANGVRRHDSDGTLDATFASGGTVGVLNVLPNAARFDVADVTVQPDGKVLVTGTGHYDDEGFEDDALVLRLNANGTVDKSFSGDGVAVVDAFTFEAGVASAVQPGTNKIIVLDAGEDGQIGVVRLNVDGSLDSTFAPGSFRGAGIATPGLGGARVEQPTDLAAGSDGNIVVGGQTDTQNTLGGTISIEFAALRLTA